MGIAGFVQPAIAFYKFIIDPGPTAIFVYGPTKENRFSKAGIPLKMPLALIYNRAHTLLNNHLLRQKQGSLRRAKPKNKAIVHKPGKNTPRIGFEQERIAKMSSYVYEPVFLDFFVRGKIIWLT